MYIHNIFYTKIIPPLETEVEGQTVNFQCIQSFKGGGASRIYPFFFCDFLMQEIFVVVSGRVKAVELLLFPMNFRWHVCIEIVPLRFFGQMNVLQLDFH